MRLQHIYRKNVFDDLSAEIVNFFIYLMITDSVKRSNCYMVWGGDVIGAGHASGGNNVDLEIGCLIDLATGLVTFTANGKEISTSYQVLNTSKQDFF